MADQWQPIDTLPDEYLRKGTMFRACKAGIQDVKYIRWSKNVFVDTQTGMTLYEPPTHWLPNNHPPIPEK